MAENTLPTKYDFHATEQRIYEWWEKSGYFQAIQRSQPARVRPIHQAVRHLDPAAQRDRRTAPGACHVRLDGRPDDPLPPHEGRSRRCGCRARTMPASPRSCRWRRLLAKEGLRREELGREKFVERTWEWKGKYGGIISSQIRRLGASCDWDRERFTLDDGLSQAVREAFVRLYEKGLIYRGPRLINWSPGLQTAVSDLEVEYSEEAGHAVLLQVHAGGWHRTSTSRWRPPARRPSWAIRRWQCTRKTSATRNSSAATVLVPILGGEIPVIADEYVDREFGTGALKITPGHDPNDYEIGQRHDLPVISMLDEAARINENGGPYAGHGSLRGAQEAVGRHAKRRAGDQRRSRTR